MLDKATVNIDGNDNIVIQNAESSTITINPNNAQEVRRLLLNFEKNIIEKLPLEIVKKMTNHSNVEIPTSGANIYLSLNYALSAVGVNGKYLGVTLTNLNKEHRYFHEPVFKSSVPFEHGLDQFKLINTIGEKVSFPKRLEYGEQFTIYYQLPNPSFFNEICKKDSQGTIVSLVSTTLGELFLSNDLEVSKILAKH